MSDKYFLNGPPKAPAKKMSGLGGSLLDAAAGMFSKQAQNQDEFQEGKNIGFSTNVGKTDVDLSYNKKGGGQGGKLFGFQLTRRF